jgi:hypothetical protein
MPADREPAGMNSPSAWTWDVIAAKIVMYSPNGATANSQGRQYRHSNAKPDKPLVARTG